MVITLGILRQTEIWMRAFSLARSLALVTFLAPKCGPSLEVTAPYTDPGLPCVPSA